MNKNETYETTIIFIHILFYNHIGPSRASYTSQNILRCVFLRCVFLRCVFLRCVFLRCVFLSYTPSLFYQYLRYYLNNIYMLIYY